MFSGCSDGWLWNNYQVSVKCFLVLLCVKKKYICLPDETCIFISRFQTCISTTKYYTSSAQLLENLMSPCLILSIKDWILSLNRQIVPESEVGAYCSIVCQMQRTHLDSVVLQVSLKNPPLHCFAFISPLIIQCCSVNTQPFCSPILHKEKVLQSLSFPLCSPLAHWLMWPHHVQPPIQYVS